MWRAEFRLCTLASKMITVNIFVFIVISEKDELETSTMARFDTDIKFSTNFLQRSFQVFFSTIVVKTWNVKARMTTR